MVRVCCDESSCTYECNGECTRDMICLSDQQCCLYENVFGFKLDDEEDEEEF